MALQSIQRAVASKSTEAAEVNAIASILLEAGWKGVPDVSTGRTEDGRAMRVYAFTGTPEGDFVLVTGPDVQARVLAMSDVLSETAERGMYVQLAPAKGRVVEQAISKFKRAARRGMEYGVGVARPKTATRTRREAEGGEYAPIPPQVSPELAKIAKSLMLDAKDVLEHMRQAEYARDDRERDNYHGAALESFKNAEGLFRKLTLVPLRTQADAALYDEIGDKLLEIRTAILPAQEARKRAAGVLQVLAEHEDAAERAVRFAEQFRPNVDLVEEYGVDQLNSLRQRGQEILGELSSRIMGTRGEAPGAQAVKSKLRRAEEKVGSALGLIKRALSSTETRAHVDAERAAQEAERAVASKPPPAHEIVFKKPVTYSGRKRVSAVLAVDGKGRTVLEIDQSRKGSSDYDITYSWPHPGSKYGTYDHVTLARGLSLATAKKVAAQFLELSLEKGKKWLRTAAFADLKEGATFIKTTGLAPEKALAPYMSFGRKYVSALVNATPEAAQLAGTLRGGEVSKKFKNQMVRIGLLDGARYATDGWIAVPGLKYGGPERDWPWDSVNMKPVVEPDYTKYPVEIEEVPTPGTYLNAAGEASFARAVLLSSGSRVDPRLLAGAVVGAGQSARFYQRHELAPVHVQGSHGLSLVMPMHRS